VLKSDFYSATSAVAGSAVDKAVRNILHGEEVASLLREHDTCAIDRFKMEQVVRNLVSNALKFSPSGSVVTVHAYFVPSEENQEWDGRQGARPPVLRKTLSSFVQTSSKQWGSSLFSTSCVQPSGRRKGFRVVADNADGKGGSDGGRSRHKTKSGPPPPQPPVDPALSLNVSDGLAGGGGGGAGGRDAVGAMSARSGVSDGDSGGEEIVNGRLVITVEDSGPGISLENQQRLFREVVQFDPHKVRPTLAQDAGRLRAHTPPHPCPPCPPPATSRRSCKPAAAAALDCTCRTAS